MRKVPPGIQIIPSVCGAPTVASGLNVVAGKSVVISRAASRSIAKIAIWPGGKLRRSPVTGYWTVVQHRSDPASITDGTLRHPRAQIAPRDIGRLFPSDEKNSIDFAHKSSTGETVYALNSIRPQKRAMVARR